MSSDGNRRDNRSPVRKSLFVALCCFLFISPISLSLSSFPFAVALPRAPVLQGGAPWPAVAAAARKGQKGPKRLGRRHSSVLARSSRSSSTSTSDAAADRDNNNNEPSPKTAAALRRRPAMKVFAVSDIHTDYPENLEWIKSLTKEEFGDDALIVAGDVSDDERTFVETFAHLSGVFRHVFFVAGNHELYLRRGTREGETTREGAAEQEAPASSGSRPGDGGGDVPSSSGSGNSGPLSSLPRPLRKFRDSVEKLAAINADLAALGERTTPTLLDGAEVVFSSSSGQQGAEGGSGGGGGAASGKGGGDGGEGRKEGEHNKRKQKKRTSTPLWIVSFVFFFSAFRSQERGRTRRRERVTRKVFDAKISTRKKKTRTKERSHCS